MNVVPSETLPEVLIVEPKVFGDRRGFFFEAYSEKRYADAGIVGPFVQDNVSRSAKNVLRGLHLQHPAGQGKLVQALEGEVYDVAVDLRVGSPTFGRWAGVTLSQDNHRQLWIPPGFAHGFAVLSETALFAYKCTGYYRPETELGVIWNDPEIGVEWPVETPTVSDKDGKYPALGDIDPSTLPQFTRGALV